MVVPFFPLPVVFFGGLGAGGTGVLGVIFVPFRDGEPAGAPLDVLTGFVDDDGNARGRPVGVVVDKSGGLLVADDVGNVIWRVTEPGAVRRAANSR